MPENKQPPEDFDWSLTTWQGSRREQMRRWAQLSLEEIITAQEEMEELAGALSKARKNEPGDRS